MIVVKATLGACILDTANMNSFTPDKSDSLALVELIRVVELRLCHWTNVTIPYVG